jgi:hypothetical protein
LKTSIKITNLEPNKSHILIEQKSTIERQLFSYKLSYTP